MLLGRVLKLRNWWDPVTDEVILGARPIGNDPQRFAKLGIKGVVNMCEEMPGPVSQYEKLGIEQLWLPTVDFNHPSDSDVEKGADFIQKHVELGDKVYIHCKAGRARSATVVLWWLVKYLGMSPEEAQAKLLEARPHTNPRVDQRPVIQRLVSQHGKAN